MMTSFLRRLALAAVLVAGTTFLPSSGMAQMPGTGPGVFGPGKVGGKSGSAEQPKPTPPSALPGANQAGSPAPAVRPPSDMEPTEALFDAINRGDIGAARDAISRGADLSGHNVLGMTPMEVSVDLGRNDISFLLLSMRGDNGRSRQPPPAETASKSRSSKQATDRSPGQARQASAAQARQAATPEQQPVRQAPRLFANDGGTPIPNAGFLGFDASQR